MIGITVFLACMQELRIARYHAGPYDAGPRQPWEADPDAWKRGGEAPREKRAKKDRTPPAEDVDRVLDRLNEVGMAGLTRKERKILERAARARRR